MPHATSDAPTDAEAATSQGKAAQHLTESILTLQQTIRNIREDVANGIAPSVLMPIDSVSSKVLDFCHGPLTLPRLKMQPQAWSY